MYIIIEIPPKLEKCRQMETDLTQKKLEFKMEILINIFIFDYVKNLYGLGLIGHAIEYIELQILLICDIHIFMIISRVCNIKIFHFINEMCCLFFTRIRLVHIIFFLCFFTFDTCFHILCAW